MHLCDLPDDVLRLVLQASVRDRVDPAKKVKTNLSLLSVCQRWRRLVLPFVYNEVRIEYNSKVGPSEVDTNAEPEDAALVSNLDSIASVGCAHTIRKVRVHLFCNINPFPGLGKVAQAMRDVEEAWGGVQMLEIVLGLKNFRENYGVNAAKYTDQARGACAALAAVMPGVRSLLFYGMGLIESAIELRGRLAELYADQLHHIRGYSPVAISQSFLLKQLRSVVLDYNNRNNYQLPRVNPAWLEHLYLRGWPANHPWAPFSMDSGSRAIEFPRLKKLCIYYSSEETADRRSWTLHFPVPKHFELECSSGACPPLELMVLPPRMKKVAIVGATAVLQRLSEIPPLTAEHFALEIAGVNNGDPAALAAANRILERAQDARTLELTVDSPRLPVPPEAVAGTSLTRLVVMAPTSLDAMLGLIRSLPRLVSLGLWELTLDEIQADISVPAPGGGCVVEPLDTQLKVVSINVNQDQPSWEMVVPVTKYLLLRIQTLAMLKAVHAPKKQIMDFVQQYSEWYPHLKHIDFSLNDSDDPFENRRNGSIIKPFEEPGRRAYF